ncbi:MAG: SCP2 sterol-binding domain-containing protein [Gammaproteobacteria bacterium]|nr:SCP2 sterol-binding domain-containing protein [Gammaproteobacteria bacterium]
MHVISGIIFGTFTTGAYAAPVLMSTEWAKSACEAWNADAVLTDKLDEWIKNDKGRGYKVMQIYRSDCENAAKVELRIENKDGKAWCVYGGAVEHAELDSGADYLMHADTKRWQEMGAGEYGPMKAMMFSRLKFTGPKMEAMGNMGPFGNFLKLVGKVESDTGSCPP